MSELVAVADATGWDRLWISEHHFHYYGGASPNPAVQLAAWARETKHIRLGPAISLTPLRNPLHIAEDYAVVDQLSGGRLDFGIGRGYLPHEFAGHNLDPDQVSAMREEGFDIIRRAWSGETFEHKGEHYSFPKLKLYPLPLQDNIPIWVGASRTRDSFEWAGHNGFNIMMNQYPMTPDDARERFGWYLEAWKEASHAEGGHEAMMSVFAPVSARRNRSSSASSATATGALPRCPSSCARARSARTRRYAPWNASTPRLHLLSAKSGRRSNTTTGRHARA
jgi:alkanesulfonate monooxygenase SsuD/methylene tetrahydromethanopterin reductase-like flavin-dependent oxidoreductase (luciferase family)